MSLKYPLPVVDDDMFIDAALILVAHGSTSNAASAAPVYQHAAELRRRALFAEVREAFWKQAPGVREVLATISARRVFVVPLFVSAGYFTEEMIPRELGLRDPSQADFERVRKRGSQTLYYTRPAGSHPSMTSVILERAREVVARYPFPRAPKPSETALLIAGHGTDRNENSRRAVERQADLIRSSGVYAEVHGVYLEESPFIRDCYTLTRALNLVMVPFFMSDGLHSDEQIPVLLGESERVVRQRLERGQLVWRNPTERQGKRVWYTRSIGSEPHLADVILDLAREAAQAI